MQIQPDLLVDYNKAYGIDTNNDLTYFFRLASSFIQNQQQIEQIKSIINQYISELDFADLFYKFSNRGNIFNQKDTCGFEDFFKGLYHYLGLNDITRENARILIRKYYIGNQIGIAVEGTLTITLPDFIDIFVPLRKRAKIIPTDNKILFSKHELQQTLIYPNKNEQEMPNLFVHNQLEVLVKQIIQQELDFNLQKQFIAKQFSIELLFQKLDRKQKGYIAFDDLDEFLLLEAQFSNSISQEEKNILVQSLMNRFDRKNSGRINLRDFYNEITFDINVSSDFTIMLNLPMIKKNKSGRKTNKVET